MHRSPLIPQGDCLPLPAASHPGFPSVSLNGVVGEAVPHSTVRGPTRDSGSLQPCVAKGSFPRLPRFFQSTPFWLLAWHVLLSKITLLLGLMH